MCKDSDLRRLIYSEIQGENGDSKWRKNKGETRVTLSHVKDSYLDLIGSKETTEGTEVKA